MIKPLTSEDIVAVAELERKYIECPYSEKVLSEFLDKHDTIAYKFESDGILVGYVSGQTVLDECNVNNVVVDERFRRQGIAQGLMAALICECRYPKRQRQSFWYHAFGTSPGPQRSRKGTLS